MEKLGAYVRGGLSKRDTADVAAHLSDCADCTATCAELYELNDALRIIIGPVILGAVATAGLVAKGRRWPRLPRVSDRRPKRLAERAAVVWTCGPDRAKMTLSAIGRQAWTLS